MSHEELWEQVIKLEGEETARRAMCQYRSDSDCYVVKLLNVDYTVDVGGKRIFSVGSDSGEVGAGFVEQLCILTYLISVKDLPLANKLVKAERLPGGEFFFRGPHSLGTEKLVEAFGERPELLYEACEKSGGKRCDYGSASAELFLFARLPLTFVIWAGDEEFGARASILFDETAGAGLPLDALWAGVNLAVKAVIKSAGGN